MINPNEGRPRPEWHGVPAGTAPLPIANPEGTSSKDGRWVRGDCACGEVNALVYNHPDDTQKLICAWCYREAVKGRKVVETCDECGVEGAWRDPLSGKNEFYCAQCHGKRGTVFQNRWSDTTREGRTLNLHPKAVCFAANKGTDCKGEIKPRSAFNGELICNKHAGKTSAGPEYHQ